MSIPELTKESIAPYLTKQSHEKIIENFDDVEIPKLFNGQGVQRETKTGVWNISMHWHRNDTDKIDGIFIRCINPFNLMVWIKADIWPQEHNFIWIKSEYVDLRKKSLMDLGELPFEIEHAIEGKKTEADCPQVIAEHLVNIEDIAVFFDKDRDVLPPSIRERVFPVPHIKREEEALVPENKAFTQQSCNWTYVGGVLGLALITGYIAYRVLRKWSKNQALEALMSKAV